MKTLRMRVERIDALTPTIRRLLLVAVDNARLPEFSAGAHIGLHVPIDGKTQRRAYSLVNAPDQTAHYEIAVQLEATGTGGSFWVHKLEVGAELDISPPKNDFALHPAAKSVLLIAGGIGITPILAMARALNADATPFELHYAAREAASMAYREEIVQLSSATCWIDGGDPRQGIPLIDTIGEPSAGRHLYVCGPRPLIEAVLLQAKNLGWPSDQVHSELFAAQRDGNDKYEFEVQLTVSHQTLRVPADKTILDVMIEAGLDPLYDCRRGDCGVCTAKVISGKPDHRDICLTEQDRADGSFCPCVSRAKSALLVLDL